MKRKKQKKLVKKFLKRVHVDSININNDIHRVDWNDPSGAYHQFPSGSYTLTVRGYYKQEK